MPDLYLTFQNVTSSTFQLQAASGANPNGAPASIPANGSTPQVVISGHNVKGYVTYRDGQGQTFTFNFYMPAVYVPGTDNSFSFSSTNGSYVAVISGDPMSNSPAYITVLVETQSQAVVTLAADYSNTHDFVQSMFATNARSVSKIFNAPIPSNPTYPVNPAQPIPFTVPFCNTTSFQRLISLWTSLWQGGAAPQSCLNSDRSMLMALAAYVQQHLPNLWVPNLTFKGWQGAAANSMPVYYVNGYTQYQLWNGSSWNQNNLQVFLSYFALGAHNVLVLDPTNVNTATITPDFYDYCYDASSIQPNLEQGIWDSHYSGVGGQNSGMSYPSTIITSDSVPNPSPLLCALLIGPTVQPVFGFSPYDNGDNRCDFFQVEGWRQFGQATAGWHNADYTAYEDTLWNFATYGACAFSEKRGTALFLAPNGWVPQMQTDTVMPHYLGNLSLQGWEQWDLVALGLSSQTQIATVSSSAAPISGNEHNSSGNFKLSEAPTGPITVQMPSWISAVLWHVNGGLPDNEVAPITAGTILPQDAMSFGNYNYYIGDPSGATSGFSVNFYCSKL
jgi:hypothetical protein